MRTRAQWLIVAGLTGYFLIGGLLGLRYIGKHQWFYEDRPSRAADAFGAFVLFWPIAVLGDAMLWVNEEGGKAINEMAKPRYQ